VSKAEKTARSSCSSASLRFFGRWKTDPFEGRCDGTAEEVAGLAEEAAAMEEEEAGRGGGSLSFTSDGAFGGICGCAY
jgi:hypothetical protein